METDHLKLGPFEIAPQSQVIKLDHDDPASGIAPSAVDAGHIEDLFEFIATLGGDATLRSWIGRRCDPDTGLAEFLTDPRYVNDRAAAVADLIGED